MTLNVAPRFFETVGISVPARNVHNFSTLNCPSSHRPSAKCAYAANAICKSTYILAKYVYFK
jgi:hypothetical protein